MPFGDGTGPAGQGPMTGRRLGYCAGYPHPGYAAGGYGRSMGYGRGGGYGHGYRWRYYATGVPGWGRGYAPPYGGYRPPVDAPAYRPPTEEDELRYLSDYAEDLKRQLNDVQKRIEELKNSEK